MELNGALQEVNLRKRDGRITAFDAEKITYAIFKALRACEKPDRQKAQDLMLEVLSALRVFENPELTLTVEQVQDEVEKVLFNNRLFDVAKSYILYRKQNEHLRNAKELLSNTDLVDNYLNLSDWRIRESANSSYSLQGLNQHLATALSAQYWMERIYPDEIKAAYEAGKLHIHDLGFLSVYCVGWDLEEMR